jgi:carboxylesterase
MMNAFQGEEHRPFLLKGGQPAALLIHGFPGTPAEMRPLAEALHQAGWTAQGLLLPGFGADIATMGRRRSTDWMVAVQTALAALRREHAPVLLIGNSMGGALALTVAEKTAPDALVLLNPFWQIDHVLWRFLPVLKHVFPQFKPFSLSKPNFDDPETRKSMRNFMPDADLDDPAVRQMIIDLQVPTGVFDQIRQVGESAHRAAPVVDCPALVMQGSEDQLVQPRHTRQLAARLKRAVYQEVTAEHNLLNPGHASWRAVRDRVVAFADEQHGRAAAIGQH